MSDILVAMGQGVTAIWGFFTTGIGVVETAIASSILLQLGLAVGGTYVGFKLLNKAIGVVKKLFSGK